MSHLKLMRIEYIAVLLASSALILIYFSQINWIHFLIFFWVIDVIGYWPGYVVALLKPDEQPALFYYRIYNTMHNVGLWSLVAAAYIPLASEPASILAPFFHLAIDRGMLGNFYKRYPETFRASTASLAASGASAQ